VVEARTQEASKKCLDVIGDICLDTSALKEMAGTKPAWWPASAGRAD
jgi:hypothetical protein